MIRLNGDSRAEQYAYNCRADQSRIKGSAELIGTFSAALCVINRDLNVLEANAAARAFIRDENGDSLVHLLNLSVACKPSALRKQFRDAIDGGAQTSLVLRTDKFEPLICAIRPIQTDLGPYGLVSLMPLTGGSKAVIPSLRHIYKLSNAEAEIAAASAAGMDVIALALARRVSVNTLRAQIASIKAKMGLSRMTEIAVVVCRIEAAVTWL